MLYPPLVDEFVESVRIDYSQESMKIILDKAKRVLSGMDKIGGKDMVTLTVALLLRNCDSEFHTEW